jgi:hypothetical protein
MSIRDSRESIIDMSERRTFADYKVDASNWITLSTGEYYPDILKDACELYKPVLVIFGQLLRSSESSQRLFLQISQIKETWRVQLCRVFRKYVSPDTSVEMLKIKRKAKEIVKDFGNRFRPIPEVQKAFESRPLPDEALCAVLWEYKDRGKKGYDLTERFFSLFRSQFPDLHIIGPERAGKDIRLGQVFKNYPNPSRPVDFVIYDANREDVLVVGLARYDSDRGGAQEDDRTSGYRNCANELLQYASENDLDLRIIFVNDGPGLLLGSMWDDYVKLEKSWPGRIKVVTLRMIPDRIARDWLRGQKESLRSDEGVS